MQVDDGLGAAMALAGTRQDAISACAQAAEQVAQQLRRGYMNEAENLIAVAFDSFAAHLRGLK